LVGIDNAHTPKTSKIFYVIDKIANHRLRKNIRFLLTASIPEFDQLLTPGRIIQVEEPYREPIRIFSPDRYSSEKDISTYRYPLPYFEEDEIKEFYKRYGNETQTNISEENLRIKAKSIYNETKGHPILVKFLVFGKGLHSM
jgi:hypothetical protein